MEEIRQLNDADHAVSAALLSGSDFDARLERRFTGPARQSLFAIKHACASQPIAADVIQDTLLKLFPKQSWIMTDLSYPLAYRFVAQPGVETLEAFLGYLRRAIAGILQTDIPTNISSFAKFMSRLDEGIAKQDVHKALNEALTVFRIPPGAANFPPPGDRGRITSAESWKAQLTDLYNRVTDVAYLRNDKGQPLDREAIRERVEQFRNEGEIDEDEERVWRDLLDDSEIEPGTWRDSQREFAKLGWSSIQKVVKARKTVRERPLGAATITFLDKESEGSLTSVDKDSHQAGEG